MEQHKPSGVAAANPGLRPGPKLQVLEPRRNGMPEQVPYTYRGSDYSLPEEITVTDTRPLRRTAREATALDDPALRYAGLPISRPQGWEDL